MRCSRCQCEELDCTNKIRNLSRDNKILKDLIVHMNIKEVALKKDNKKKEGLIARYLKVAKIDQETIKKLRGSVQNPGSNT